MKHLSLLILLITIPYLNQAQSNALPDLEPYFTAIIVEDIDTSIVWYQHALGFEVLNEKAFPDMGFKQANIKRGHILIELIELNSAVSPEKTIPNYTAKTRLIGFFKTGFQVTDFDLWVAHFREVQVEFHGRIVSDEESGKRMVIIKDPDKNRIQIFEK